jgi:hypothetical protein
MCDELLAGAALAQDQHGQRGIDHAAQPAQHRCRGGVACPELAELGRFFGRPRGVIDGARLRGNRGALHDLLEPCRELAQPAGWVGTARHHAPRAARVLVCEQQPELAGLAERGKQAPAADAPALEQRGDDRVDGAPGDGLGLAGNAKAFAGRRLAGVDPFEQRRIGQARPNARELERGEPHRPRRDGLDIRDGARDLDRCSSDEDRDRQHHAKARAGLDQTGSGNPQKPCRFARVTRPFPPP